jgi:hypothetical protein
MLVQPGACGLRSCSEQLQSHYRLSTPAGRLPPMLTYRCLTVHLGTLKPGLTFILGLKVQQLAPLAGHSICPLASLQPAVV